MKTKRLLEKEQDRAEKVKRARENALHLAMEKSAYNILKERRYESNTKRHSNMIEQEAEYKKEMFMTIQEQRSERRRHTLEKDEMLDRKGI